MTDTLEIYVDLNNDQGDTETTLVGRCRYIAKRNSQSSVFEYTEKWLKHPQAFAIDPANLPLDRQPFYTSSSKSALPGALRDTAPDRWGQQLIKRAFRKAGENRALSEIDYLLAINDRTRIGALRYKREHENSFDHNIGPYRVPPLIQLPALMNAADAVQTNTETADDLRLLLNEGSPLGGARPKSAVVDNEGLLAIAKFPKPDDDRSIPHGEVLAMKLAKRAGMQVADAKLQDVAGRPVALISRFDRHKSQRIPFLSAMSLLGLSDGDEATYIDIAECIRMYSSEPKADLHELWRRIIFSVLIGNLDDHLRNHGFLYDGEDKWRLSPAYDLNPVPASEKTRELSTWISDAGPDADVDQALSAAPYFALKNKQALAILNEVSIALKGWQSLARQLGMNPADIAVYATAIKP
ncbi:phosphatidylinositol kinase [Pseudohongiella nitratireducens]|jgi:serine/threonine-protein kinase HipA|uniref:Phosphatidylinositol kinase n=1 Tax=Pseudohongiella nitratireducens TaxID=1768907 RepID=A0A916VJI9_9GAMM|nr:type II toxin-antitoxin system HipA family toxin [Pseudohongiella nitratireducens]GFZ79097.1 phosphatidylinositol kinase [Pseudohongiella nitratireducens]